MADVSSLDERSFDGLECSLYCAKCKVRTRIEYLYITNNNNRTYFAIAQCIDCEGLTFFQYQQKLHAGINLVTTQIANAVTEVELIYSFPFTSEVKIDDVPEKFAKTYLEGVRCLDANSPNGSVAMFRRTLQQICVERGADPSKKLVNQIEVLPIEVKPTADEIREWGNLGAHEDNSGKVIDVNRTQAESIKRFLEQIFLVLYQHPAELKRLQKARK